MSDVPDRSGGAEEAGVGSRRGADGGGARQYDPGYDEFGMLHENASEVGLPHPSDLSVERVFLEVDADGRKVSALKWGEGDPEVVLIHGGAQNAHTWDTVALALDRPALAVDLPGHGHSDWREDHAYWPPMMAADLAKVLGALAPDADLVVGMSLGGLTSLCLAATHPYLVERLAVVDVTPGTDHAKAEPIVTFISGPETFASFDEILDRTIEHNPTRSESSLRRGVLHNAKENPDGTWSWRYDAVRDWNAAGGDEASRMADFSNLWEAVDAVDVPLLLLRGGNSGVVGDEDVEELQRRRPEAEVIVVPDAGHSIQGDQPLVLAQHLHDFIERAQRT